MEAIICGSIDMITPIDSGGIAGRTDRIALPRTKPQEEELQAEAQQCLPKLTFHSQFLFSRKPLQPWMRRQPPAKQEP